MPRNEVRGSQPGASDGRCSWWKEDQRRGRGRGVSRWVCVPRYNGSPKSHPEGQAGTYRTFLTFLTSSGPYLWLMLLGRELRPPCDSSCPLKTARFVTATLFFFFLFFPPLPVPSLIALRNAMACLAGIRRLYLSHLTTAMITLLCSVHLIEHPLPQRAMQPVNLSIDCPSSACCSSSG